MAAQHFTPEELAAEEWRPVVGAEGTYSVSSLGRVRSEDRLVILNDGRPQPHRGKLLSVHANPHRSGYMYTALRRHSDKIRGSRVVHRLVAEAFIREMAPGEEVDHDDFDTSNNRAGNLKIVKHPANVAHTVRADRHMFGSRAPWAKLTDADVVKIFAMSKDGVSQAAIGRCFGVTQAQVWRILHGTRWRHAVAQFTPHAELA